MLPGIELGLILFDSCSRPSYAYNSIYNFSSFPREAFEGSDFRYVWVINESTVIVYIRDF
jgi:hypothetical protein